MPSLKEKIVAYLAKTSGRDKAMRVIQFFFRFVKGILLKIREKQGNSTLFASIIKKFDIVASNISLARRLLRFGRTMGFEISLMKLIQNYKSRDKSNPFDKLNFLWLYVIPHAVSDVLTIIQFYFDHYLYLHKIGVFSNPKLYKLLNIFCDWSWFFDILLCIYYCYFEIWLLKRKAKEVSGKSASEQENNEKNDSSKELQSINQKIFGLKTDIGKLAFDLPVCYYYIDEHYSHIIWIGLSGTISSSIGAYQVW